MRSTGTILWYNGRRRLGLLQADESYERLQIPSQGAPNCGAAPPVPGGLMHGTRVSYALVRNSVWQNPVCLDVRPLDGQTGLSCGGDSQIGYCTANEDRTVATDLPEGLGHMVGIFDGHQGTFCADYLLQHLPQAIVTSTCNTFSQKWSTSPAGMDWSTLTSAEEADLISRGLVSGFQTADQNFLAMANPRGLYDGASALVALIVHGFEVPALRTISNSFGGSTVDNAPGGQAKLFAANCGTGRILLLRGRSTLRCTEEHVCSRDDERRRLEALGAIVLQDPHGVWWAGRSDRMELAQAKEQGYDTIGGHNLFSKVSRGFGDLALKLPPTPVLTATPDVRVVDLVPEDWAVVLAGQGVLSVLTDQEIADICWETVCCLGRGPIETARALTQRSLLKGAQDNTTCIVMRLGWAKPPAPPAP